MRTARAAWMLLASLAAGEAEAQVVGFDTTPLALPSRTAPAQVALAPWSAPPALDLLVAEPRPTAFGFIGYYRRGDLAPLSLPWPTSQFSGSCVAAGSWAGPGLPPGPGDGLGDIAWCAASDLRYQLSSDLSPLSFGVTTLKEGVATGLAFARLLDRADLALAVGETMWMEIAPAGLGQLFYYPAAQLVPAPTFALQPIRLGPLALGPTGLQDLAWTRVGRPEVYVLWTLLASSQPALANWDGQLLTFASAAEVRGVGAADFDGDGIPDLLAVVVPGAGSPHLLGVHNFGPPQSFAPSNPVLTVDVGAALGLVAPAFAAPLDLDGVPAVAVFDGGAAPRLHVVTADPGAPGLRSWSTPVDPSWGTATQVLAGDLVGSPAADLVAVFVNAATSVATIRVWPGDLPPSIAWASPPPGGAGTAAPLTLSVDASDPDGTVASVDLRLQGLPSGIAPVQSGTRYSFTVPAATLCALLPSATVQVAVRATDNLGVWREVSASMRLSDAPALALAGAGSTLAVPLLPGGTQVALSAGVADGCGRPVTVNWTPDSRPAGATVASSSTANASTWTIAVPEAAYPAWVASPGPNPLVVTVTATATATGGVAPGTASVKLAFDASGLVAADHRSDRAALGPGELALLTTTLRSRIGVALPQVALDVWLPGLVAAGPARVSGAQLVPSADLPGGLSVGLDQVPGGGAPVVVEVPVRLGVDAAGGSSRAQAVAAASGVALSAAAEASAPRATPAGISCGAGAASPPWLLALLLYMKAMRRVPARTRSTSSRTPMSRQA